MIVNTDFNVHRYLSMKTTPEFEAREVRHTRLTNNVSEVKNKKCVISNTVISTYFSTFWETWVMS